MTPITAPPAARAALARTPIEPTSPPPYTSLSPRRATAAPRASAAAGYSGRFPLLEPQKTQTDRIFDMVPSISAQY